ncbi:uncharacterized protein MYCGRDRAFT_96366 [Zymoseptoria tritici IPO323]|uniref:BTB domain-containing protein n=1 Tax=Zymoseptoria tritici (strain CBS 115943 / IPO323) TaxID=336722 RepID=F9XLW4_ZYMTI|nr:uncharacterized protein MYCGRDRAFT_96366 [Zymoseptoria tritici IPO323]EGP84021.1 hypothetical protein MYCGRDRAFT_96366 [Zymoseptoria tritici IPO323]
MTANTANIRDLWQNKTYSDLIIRAYGEEDLHCNQCIVYPRSKRIKDDVSKNGHAGAEIDQDEAGRIVIDYDGEEHTSMIIMVHAMYEGDESEVFRGQEPERIVGAIKLAVQDQQFEFAKAAFRALLPSGPNADIHVNGDDMLTVIQTMRETTDKYILAMADKLEMAWMPMLLSNSWSRGHLKRDAIQKFLASMKPREEEEDTSEATAGFVMQTTRDPTPPPPSPAPKPTPKKKATPKRKRQATSDGFDADVPGFD